MLKKTLDFLDGKKTFIGIGVGVVYSLLVTFNVVPNSEAVWGLIAAFTGVSYRLALKK